MLDEFPGYHSWPVVILSAPKAAEDRENVLYLNGDGEGVVNNCCFPSAVSKSYAPPGKVWLEKSSFPV